MTFNVNARNLLWIVPLLMFFGGCVANQKIDFGYKPDGISGKSRTSTVRVEVDDSRPDVNVSGKKGTYIGTMRGGYGNTFNVNTKSGEPLSEIVKRDLSSDLRALGYPVSDTGFSRIVKVTLDDWKFDAYLNTTYWYDIKVVVMDTNRGELFQHTLKESHTIEGSAWTGAKKSLMREVPKLYGTVIRKMVRDNPDVRRALDK